MTHANPDPLDDAYHHADPRDAAIEAVLLAHILDGALHRIGNLRTVLSADGNNRDEADAIIDALDSVGDYIVDHLNALNDVMVIGPLLYPHPPDQD